MGTLSFRIREFTLPTYPISIVNAQLTWPLSDTITWRHKRLFFHITRLSRHHIAMRCHHKVILHQAQGYFRKLWSWVQQAFHAGIRPTLPNEGCRAAGQVAVMLSLFSAPLPTCSSQPPNQSDLLGGFPCLSFLCFQMLPPLFFFMSLQNILVHLLMYFLFFCLS